MKVVVSEAVLNWAVNHSGKSEVILRKFPKLSEWLNGVSVPTFHQLKALAEATHVPFGYFFLSKPPEEKLSISNYRTVNKRDNYQPSADLIEIIQTMEWRQDWMRNYLIEEGAEPLSFVRSVSLLDNFHIIAREIKMALGLDNEWASKEKTWFDAIRSLREKMESIGILVVISSYVGNNTHRKLDVSEFRGLVLVDDYAPFVFVNGADSKAAQMFTLAHELAHIWFGRSAAFDLQELQPAPDDIEEACNKVAAEFLVSEEDLLAYWPTVESDPKRFQYIARKFKVSELVAIRRALDLKLITKDEFLSFYHDYQNAEREIASKSHGGGNYYTSLDFRLSQHFAEAIIASAKEGKLPYRDAYRFLGLNRTTFEKYAERLGFGE